MAHLHLRVSDKDREQVVEHVTVAFTEGRLTKDEFDERLHRAMTARVHGDLVPIMTDIYGTRPPVRRGPPRFRPGPPPREGVRARDGGDRVGAAAAHLLPFLGIFILGPLIMMLTGGKTSPYIRKHAVEALNFQLTVFLASIVLAVTFVGMVLVPFVWVGGFIASLIGGIIAMTDGDFRYPLNIRMVK
ncbi:DUF1707 and DUF4870 domain-containing protein [Sinosporangium siamense]|nr:DUF1707 and DUF4870 domain-containing protein [Sinosporangium siamense]